MTVIGGSETKLKLTFYYVVYFISLIQYFVLKDSLTGSE